MEILQGWISELRDMKSLLHVFFLTRRRKLSLLFKNAVTCYICINCELQLLLLHKCSANECKLLKHLLQKRSSDYNKLGLCSAWESQLKKDYFYLLQKSIFEVSNKMKYDYMLHRKSVSFNDNINWMNSAP